MPKNTRTRHRRNTQSQRPRLTRAERKKLAELSARVQQDAKKPRSAQDTIPYQRMWPDGICRVTDTYFTKTIQFQDINYQLAQNEDKTAIFAGWCDCLNYFDSSIRFQFSFYNMVTGEDTFEESIRIPEQPDGFNSIRREYSEMLQNQLAKGNNGLTKTKYITFGIDAEDIRTAKPRLNRIELDILNNFKKLGVAAEPLDGKARLQLMHSIFHMDTQEKFAFEWPWLPASGLSTKDFIAPSSFSFKQSRTFSMGAKHGTVSFLQILAPELNDRMLADFLSMESSVIVTMHVRSIDQTEAIKMVKRKITDLDKSKIDEQKKAVRAGYDIDIIPSDLQTYGAEAKKLLQDLQSHNERMFLLTFLVMNTADTKRQLDINRMQAQGIAQQYNCTLVPLDYRQEQALVSSLPLGLNQIEIQRGLTTSSTAIFVPFTTQELFQTYGEPLYYGLNALSHNIIMVDRKLLKNPNGLILGTPGSGKSFTAKREIINLFLITKDDIIICDPEGEYFPLVNQLKGQVIHISPTSGDYINPMDINLNYSDDENPLSLKSDFILSLCELIIGGRDGLKPIEKTVIDRAVRQVYQPYLNDPRPENMPILEDLYNALMAQDEKEAHHVATALEIYVSGSLNLFNHRTNVDSPHTAEWRVSGKTAISSTNIAAHVTYGTARASAYKILEDSLNLRDVRIFDIVEDPDGAERRVLNQKETTLAQQKQQAIKDAFSEWLWRDPDRRHDLVTLYNEKFNAIRPREYDGKHIAFGGMSPEITLREHQRNAIAHVLYGGNTLLAHQVGAGKTFEMVASAMEAKRLGLCTKSMFVVPNHLTEQWASEFLRLYPSANILVTNKRDFEKSRRKKFCARIATGDYDAVIIGHSQFEKIPISQERQERLIQEQIDEITAGIEEIKRESGERYTIKQMEKSRRQLETRLQKLQANGKKDDVITFEELGVDRLFVDEGHMFKNLFFDNKNAKCCGLVNQRSTEIQRYVCQVQIHG